MVSYFKTQWWKSLISFFCILYAIHFIVLPAPDETTIEGVRLTSKYMCNAIAWLVNGLIWAWMSFVNWHGDCIRELEKRVSLLENRAVTDIDKVSDNNYTVRRRLGADKDVPFPEEFKHEER